MSKKVCECANVCVESETQTSSGRNLYENCSLISAIVVVGSHCGWVTVCQVVHRKKEMGKKEKGRVEKRQGTNADGLGTTVIGDHLQKNHRVCLMREQQRCFTNKKERRKKKVGGKKKTKPTQSVRQQAEMQTHERRWEDGR